MSLRRRYLSLSHTNQRYCPDSTCSLRLEVTTEGLAFINSSGKVTSFEPFENDEGGNPGRGFLRIAAIANHKAFAEYIDKKIAKEKRQIQKAQKEIQNRLNVMGKNPSF